MNRLTVNLGAQSYDILIGAGLLSTLGEQCCAVGLKGRVAVITNPTVNGYYGETVLRSLGDAGLKTCLIEIPDGEEYKNSATLGGIYDRLIDAGLDRSSFIVALGGGVVGDMAGYAAATYLRGIPFVQVPTTLLAQVDSSVGGKTGIDHPSGKNLIGAFYQPRLVLIDTDTLSTLDPRQYHAGMAEVIKYAAVLDSPLFSYLEHQVQPLNAMERESLITVISRCCKIKAHVVEIDEKESGLRAVLNYGHTLGHALETVTGYSQILHGEAVAIGMVLASRISAARGLCSQEDVSRIEALLSAFALPTVMPDTDPDALVAAVTKDKKAREGVIQFICNRAIGDSSRELIDPQDLMVLAGLLPGDDVDADVDVESDEILEDLEIIEDDHDDVEDDYCGLETAPPSRLDPLSTITVADLYVQQGFIERGCDIYRAILAADPDNADARDRLAKLGQTADQPATACFEQPQQSGTVQPLEVLEGWLENIRRIRACR